MNMFKKLAVAALLAAIPAVASAQSYVRLHPVYTSDTISSNGDSVVLTSERVGGFGSVKVQTLDSYSGTWEVQCSADGTNYDASAELKLTAADSSTVVTSVTDSVGIWDVANAGGCRSIRVISTAGFAASDTVVVISATQAGGGGGASGGGSSFDGVLLDAAGGDPVTDTANNAIRVNIIAGAGSGGTAAADESAFTLASTSVTPMGCIEATDTQAAGVVGAVKCGADRELDVDVTNAFALDATVTTIFGSDAIFGTAGTADADVLTIQGIASMTPIQVADNGGSLTVDGTVTITDGSGVLNVICDSGCSGGTQYAEDAAHADGHLSSPMMAIRRDTTPSTTTATAGDYGVAAIDANGRLYVQAVLYNSSGTELTADTQATHATTLGTITSVTGGVLMGNASTATPTDVGADGDAAALWLTRNGALNIADAGGSLTVDNAGTFAVQATIATATGWGVRNEDTAEAADMPLMAAGAFVRSTASASAGVAAGDITTLNVDTLGRLWVREGNPCADHARVTTAAINTASSGNVEIVALNGSDLVYVCGLSIVVDSAVDIQLIYGTGTACATGETDLTGPYGFAANGGIALASAGHPQFVVPAGNALCVETSGAVQTSGHVSYVRTAAP